MTLVAEGPPKYCAACGFMRPRSDFYARRSANGGIYATALCKAHEKARVIASQRDDPERRLGNLKRFRDRRRQDPERMAIHRDQQRQSARRRLGIKPERYRVRHSTSPQTSIVLDAVPFIGWLGTLGHSFAAIGRRVELDEGQVRKYMTGQRNPTLDVVDAALLAAGTTMTLDDLYPMNNEQED